MQKIVVALLVLIVGPIVVWKTAYPTYSYRYRLVLAVEVDGQIKTGSSVIEVSWRSEPNVLGQSKFPAVRGQSTFVEIGERQAIVTLLHRAEGYGLHDYSDPKGAIFLATTVFGIKDGAGNPRDLPEFSGRRQLDLKTQLPPLIYFPDTSDRASARLVTPSDLETIPGHTLRIADAYIEIVSFVPIPFMGVTIDIYERLPWLRALENENRISGVMRKPGEFLLLYSMFVAN